MSSVLFALSSLFKHIRNKLVYPDASLLMSREKHMFFLGLFLNLQGPPSQSPLQLGVFIL